MREHILRRSAEVTARLTALIAAVVLAFVVGLFVLWYASGAILVLLVGIVFAIVLDAGARGIGAVVDWPRPVRLVLVYLLAATAIVGVAWWSGARLVTQAGELSSAVQGLLRRASNEIANGGLIPAGTFEVSQFLPSAATVFGGATAAFTSVFGTLVTIGAVIFLGAFFSWEPRIYKSAVLNILPADKRVRVNEVLGLAADAMRDWLVGQSISMAAVFAFTLAALLVIDMPYAVLLAVQAGLLAFVPTLGSFAAGIVIVLAGLSQSPTLAVYGLGVYLVIQFFESNLLTPMVQQRTISLPPAITLGVQMVAGVLFGLLGVAFAVPIAAAAKVLIEELYVKDALGGPWREEDAVAAEPAVTSDAPPRIVRLP